MFTIKIPYVISTHVKKFSSTASLVDKAKAAALGMVSGVLYVHSGSALEKVARVSSTGNAKMASGIATCVTGTIAVSSGLASIAAVQITPIANATGNPDNTYSYAIGATGAGATGAFTAYAWNWVTGALVADATGTGSFAWTAWGA
jgi:hypothetical protein